MIEISHRGNTSRYQTLTSYLSSERQELPLSEDFEIYNYRLSIAKHYAEATIIVAIFLHVSALVTFGISLLTGMDGSIRNTTEVVSVASLVFILLFTLSSYYYLHFYCEGILNALAVPKGLESIIRVQEAEISNLVREIERLNNETIPVIKDSSSALLPKKNDRWTDMDIVSVND